MASDPYNLNNFMGMTGKQMVWGDPAAAARWFLKSYGASPYASDPFTNLLKERMGAAWQRSFVRNALLDPLGLAPESEGGKGLMQQEMAGLAPDRSILEMLGQILEKSRRGLPLSEGETALAGSYGGQEGVSAVISLILDAIGLNLPRFFQSGLRRQLERLQDMWYDEMAGTGQGSEFLSYVLGRMTPQRQVTTPPVQRTSF